MSLENVHVYPDYVIRELSIKRLDNGQEKQVKQFHYTSWPDFGVPDEPRSVLNFIGAVNTRKDLNSGPMVINFLEFRTCLY